MPLFNRGSTLDVIQSSMKRLPVLRRWASEKFKKTNLVQLLVDEDSPNKNSPPKPENGSAMEVDLIQYFSPKRSLSDSEISGCLEPALKIRKQERIYRPAVVKTINLNVNVQGELGLTIERDNNSTKAKYVISKIDLNAKTTDHQQLWLGDEVIKISKQQICEISENELKHIIANCLGKVELVISRDPEFSFKGSLWDDWAMNLVPRSQDEQIWKLINPENASVGNEVKEAMEHLEIKQRSCCEIVGYLKKDGNGNETEKKIENDENAHKVTGMKKFFFKKIPVNLPEDLPTVQ